MAPKNFGFKIGFIGLGLMGRPMALSILKKGFSLSVYNRTIEKTKEFQKLGARVLRTPGELAANSDIVITMITGPKDVADVYLGKDGIQSHGREGLLCIDMSTVGPSTAIRVGKELKKHGIHFLDAPVTGSVPVAQKGELTIFVGGEKSQYEKVKPVLLAMGKNLHYMGSSGSGQAIKLVNNLIIAITFMGLSEGFLLGESLGLRKKDIARALSEVPALSFFMRLKLKNIVENSYVPIFSLANMLKDVGLAIEEIRKNKVLFTKLHASRYVYTLYKRGFMSGLGREDVSALFKVIAG